MKRKTKKVRRKPSGKGRSRGRRIASLKAMADDWGAPPLNAKDWASGAARWYRPRKRLVTLRLDADVVAWFKKQGRGYQTRINGALRRVMMGERQTKKKE